MRAACLGPALADFDALLLLRRDALPAADLALQGPKAWRAMAAKSGFQPLQPPGQRRPGQQARPGSASRCAPRQACLSC